MYPEYLNILIEYFKSIPGVGSKTAERYALLMLSKDEAFINGFAQSLIDVKTKIKSCSSCGNLSDEDVCLICKDKTRDAHKILVVSNPQDVIAFEKTGEYHGLYHVLNGVLSQQKGVLPEDLNIESLKSRVTSDVEVIIATNPTLEGETTALYLQKVLQQKGVITSRLAYGLPMGGHVDYADELTLIKALEGRKQL